MRYLLLHVKISHGGIAEGRAGRLAEKWQTVLEWTAQQL
jgi:hypothetical protein